MKKFIVASLVFELMALASVAFLVFTAPRPVPSPRPAALPSVQDDIARGRRRLEAAQGEILWNVMALLGVSMGAQLAYLVAATRTTGRPDAQESGAKAAK